MIKVNQPVYNLREFGDLKETISKETVKSREGDHYLVIVYKSEDDSYGCYWHNHEMPHAFHDIANGFVTEEEAREYAFDQIGADKED